MCCVRRPGASFYVTKEKHCSREGAKARRFCAAHRRARDRNRQDIADANRSGERHIFAPPRLRANHPSCAPTSAIAAATTKVSPETPVAFAGDRRHAVIQPSATIVHGWVRHRRHPVAAVGFAMRRRAENEDERE
jgi:hypothetical protein